MATIRSRRRSRVAGAILLDAMLALTMGTTLLLATSSVLAGAASANDAAAQNISAYNSARQVVENLRLFKAAKLTNGTYTDATKFGAIPQLSRLTQGSASVVISSPRSGVSLKQANITITWVAGQPAHARSRTITALFTKNGIAP